MRPNLSRFTASPTAARARGMSLIEIIIVIVLIGAVLTFVGSRVLGGSDRAKFNLAKSQAQTLAGKVEQFELDVGRLPRQLDELVASPGETGWLGPYAKAEELKDPWGNAFEFNAGGSNGGRFVIVSFGADGRPGGDSVNQDIRFE